MLKTLYEDDILLVVEKPAGIDIEGTQKILPEGTTPAHRLDKDTSGILLIAKTKEALDFFRKQFKERRVEKKYICLAEGNVKGDETQIRETLLGRSPADRRKQKVFLAGEPGSEGKRMAVSSYRVLERYRDYTLLEVMPKTGRKHQIRTQMAYLRHPIAGDKLYGFKNQPRPEGLNRQFLHASYLKVQLPSGKIKEFKSELPEDLKLCLQKLKTLSNHN